MEFIASQYLQHNELCKTRLDTKNKTGKIDRKFMEIFSRISNDISSMVKTKVNSAVISKRKVFQSPIGKPRLPMNSPLITNRGVNKLQDISKTLTERNKISTPSMPSRSSGFDIGGKDQFQMNKIVRKDNAKSGDQSNTPCTEDWKVDFKMKSFDKKDKDASMITKPPRPALKKDDSTYADAKSESKINSTMETTPDTKEFNTRKFAIKPIKVNNLEEIVNEDSELKKTDPIKQETIIKSKKEIARIQIPNDVRSAMLSRATTSYTPGISKRKLTRNTNFTINSSVKPEVPINGLPDINAPNSKQNQESFNDPLNRYAKKDELEMDSKKSSLNFLKQFGATPNRKPSDKKFFDFSLDMTNNPVSMETKSKSTVPTFKKEKSGEFKEKISISLKALPALKDIPKFRKRAQDSSTPADNSEESKEKATPVNFVLRKPKKRNEEIKDSKSLRIIYSKTKNNKLSVIQEENKFLADSMPKETVPMTPYLRN